MTTKLDPKTLRWAARKLLSERRILLREYPDAFEYLSAFADAAATLKQSARAIEAKAERNDARDTCRCKEFAHEPGCRFWPNKLPVPAKAKRRKR